MSWSRSSALAELSLYIIYNASQQFTTACRDPFTQDFLSSTYNIASSRFTGWIMGRMVGLNVIGPAGNIDRSLGSRISAVAGPLPISVLKASMGVRQRQSHLLVVYSLLHQNMASRPLRGPRHNLSLDKASQGGWRAQASISLPTHIKCSSFGRTAWDQIWQIGPGINILTFSQDSFEKLLSFSPMKSSCRLFGECSLPETFWN